MPAEVSVTDSVKLNGTNAQVGIILKINPQVSTKFASVIDLTAAAELNELVDMSPQYDGSQLKIRTTKADGTVTLWEGQTLMLTRSIENVGQPIKKNKAASTVPKMLVVFITPTLDRIGKP